ncbi:hypothetical protein ASB57_27760 [Bordetella sp. N]|nr:hypothetical protein ASB57_27760 [Bordetella sp. N]
MRADAVLILHASQTGQAVELAEMTAGVLRGQGVTARVAGLGGLDAAGLATWPRVLFVASTYGEGDPPDDAAVFADRVMGGLPDLQRVQYAVLALGDATYTHFCGFGRQLAAWLRASGATALFDTVEVDRADGAALRRWQAALLRLSEGALPPSRHVVADPQRPAPSAPAGAGAAAAAYGTAAGHAMGVGVAAPGVDFFDAALAHRPWRLQERVHVNAGSSGAGCYHLALVPADGSALPDWQAGDIAEILFATAELEGVRRDYSIASLPADGAIHLLLRQRHGPDGVMGVVSGWLTSQAALGAMVSLRIRRHSAFHAPVADVPMILIGNGTGIAGLRAHLKARVQAGRRRNWLLFGERHAATDRYYDADIAEWQGAGFLPRVDRVYSRDGGQHRYVQDALAAAAPALREWVSAGAAIYVCGSIDGMAAGVDTVLREVLGDAQVTALTQATRYRRDVY